MTKEEYKQMKGLEERVKTSIEGVLGKNPVNNHENMSKIKTITERLLSEEVNGLKKIYLASGISDTPRKEYQKKMAKKIRELGYEVYAASENDSINDKSNDPTPLDIYKGDIERVKESDILVVCISGGNEDGTLSEIGMVAGWNEAITEYNQLIDNLVKETEKDNYKLWKEKQIALPYKEFKYKRKKAIKIIAYTTNERLMQPQFWHGIASGGFNHLVAGMIDKWGTFVGGEEDLIEVLKRD